MRTKFLWAVVFLGMLAHSQEAASQGFRPLEPLRPLTGTTRAAVATVPAVSNYQANLDAERQLEIQRVALGQQLIATQVRDDSIAQAQWLKKQKSNNLGVQTETYYTTTPSNFPVNGDEVDRFLWALAYKVPESGGDYNAKHKNSSAKGKHGFTDDTWYKAATRYSQAKGVPLREVITQTPLNQERVARFEVERLYIMFGRDWRNVASIWYVGKPFYQVNPNRVPRGNTLSIGEYVNRTINGMKQ